MVLPPMLAEADTFTLKSLLIFCKLKSLMNVYIT